MEKINQPVFFVNIVLMLILVSCKYAEAQDLALTEDKIETDAFRNSVLINAQTTTVAAKHSFEFSIRHRFGTVAFDKNFIKYFLGLDLAANIRFGFIFPVTDKMYVGAGRTKNGKTYDFEAKHLLLSQTTDNVIPVSVAVYADASVNTDDFLPVSKYAYFDNEVTPFAHKFNHRLAYNSQLIISRKFSDKFSFQVTPAFIYRNLVSVGQDNYTLVLPFSGAYKTGMNSSLLFEYAYLLNNKPENKIYPLSVAMEFGTAGHVFQLVVSSSQEILDQQLYTSIVSDYTKGKFLFGFNIKRTFWKKKK